jgi:hypothetical protein
VYASHRYSPLNFRFRDLIPFLFIRPGATSRQPAPERKQRKSRTLLQITDSNLSTAQSYQLLQLLYCTINVTVVVCCTVPEVPVTVTGYVPAGVPVGEPTFGNPLPAQPLRQPAEIKSKANAPIGINRFTLRRPNFVMPSEASVSVSRNAASHHGRV